MVLTVPGDKSISHRALILGALAQGESRITGLLDAADTRSTARVLEALGVGITWEAGPAVVAGVGIRGFRTPAGPLDCGNSGTTARLLLGALAGCPVEAVLTGDASLRGRPMGRIMGPLAAVGARFKALEGPDRLPIQVSGGALEPIDADNPRSSAQVKTGLLLAGLNAGVPVRVRERGRPRDHTERMLRAMGAEVDTLRGDQEDVITMEPVEALEPLELRVPGDLSSAAFFLALGALGPGVEVEGVGLNPTRAGFLAALERMGGEVAITEGEVQGGEPVGTIRVRGSELRGTVVEPHEVPTLVDEIPILAVLASRAAGESRFLGVGELRVKESDRIEALVRNFQALGVDAEAGPDHLTVRGSSAPMEGTVDAFGDHRIAMAFGVLGALPENRITVKGREAVAISYPGFWDDLTTGTEG